MLIEEWKKHNPPIPRKPIAKQNCRNIATDYCDEDQFVCSECGLELQNWFRVEHIDDDGEIIYHEYRLRFCPNCGRKVVYDEHTN